MKKWLLALLAALLLTAAVFADHPGKTGLGGIVGNGYNYVHNLDVHGYDFYTGLSLYVDPVPIFWGFYGHVFPNSGTGAFGVTGDFYIFEWTLVSKTAVNDEGSYDINIHWYLGVGFFGDMYFWKDYLGLDGGIRIPFGVSWHATDNLEIAAGIAPGIGIYGHPDIDARFYYRIPPLEVAVRYWWF